MYRYGRSKRKNRKITSTPGHKYYLPFNSENREKDLIPEHANYITLSDKWVSACKLKPGDNVLLFNKTYAIIKAIEVVCLSTPEITYNFEVEDCHTYFVGDNPVCVHNANCGVGVHGWEGDSNWRANVKTVDQGGTITELKGGIPTKDQGIALIKQSNGTILRIESGHNAPNPHQFYHINYITKKGIKGTLKILP